MRNLMMVVQYDGTDFAGWQIQPGKATIQGLLTECLTRIEGQHVCVHGSGRTDAGVHALGQVANFRMNKLIEVDTLRLALNANLPPTIRVIRLAEVDASFQARGSARTKTYRYQVYQGVVLSPFIHRYVWHAPFPIDVPRMQQAAPSIEGEHDFGSFSTGSSRQGIAIREIYTAEFQSDAELLIFTITGNGFLRYMVRRLMSGLYAIGRGRLSLETFADLLARPRENNLVPPLPAKGLTLVKVDY